MNYLKTLKDLFAFMKNTRLPETQMKELQNRKLRTLLHFAWEHSAFYRRAFEKAGITEEQLGLSLRNGTIYFRCRSI